MRDETRVRVDTEETTSTGMEIACENNSKTETIGSIENRKEEK